MIESQVPENREQYIYTVRLGSDFVVDARNTITVSGVHNYEHHVDVAQVPFILQATGQRERFWFWRESEGTGFTNATFDVTRRLGSPGHELSINLQYTRGKEDEAYFLNEESPVRIGTDDTHIIAIENTLPLSIDYTRPLPTGRLELGTKLQRRWIPVTYTVRRGVQSVIYPGLGEFSNWDENIFAGYANLVRITPRYTLEGGLRLEDPGVVRDSTREPLLPGQRRVRLFRRVPEREADGESDAHEPADRRLQPARRPSGRARAAHLPEV